jgi:hypothetical protein
MKKIIYLSILAVLLAACSSNKSEVEKIEVQIPTELQNNDDAKELVEDMTDAVNSCRENMAIGAQFAIEQEKSGSDSLTMKQGFKAAKFAAKMMFAAKKIEKIRAEALELKPELSETEWTVLEVKLDALETSVGDLNPEDLGLSEEDLAKFKEEGELHLGNENSEAVELVNEETASNQADLESGMALRELEESIIQSANGNNEMEQAENNSEGGLGWIGILFTILVIVLVVIGVRRSIRSYKRKFRNASDTFSQVRNQFKK